MVQYDKKAAMYFALLFKCLNSVLYSSSLTSLSTPGGCLGTYSLTSVFSFFLAVPMLCTSGYAISQHFTANTGIGYGKVACWCMIELNHTPTGNLFSSLIVTIQISNVCIV